MKKIFALLLAIVLCVTFSLGQTKSDTPKKAAKATAVAKKGAAKESTCDKTKCAGMDKASCEKAKKTADGKDCCAGKTGDKKAECMKDSKKGAAKTEKSTDEQKKDKE